MKPETINYAAIVVDGRVWAVPRPGRHHDVIRWYCERTGAPRIPPHSEQGFLTSTGRFIGRREAFLVALRSGQIGADEKPRQLHSEDLW